MQHFWKIHFILCGDHLGDSKILRIHKNIEYSLWKLQQRSEVDLLMVTCEGLNWFLGRTPDIFVYNKGF